MISSERSEKVICEINMKLPSLNDYIAVCRRNRYEAANYKRKLEKDIAVFLRRLPVFTKPVTIGFTWIEQNRRRDLDNVAFSKKFILDAMVKTGKLADDSSRYVIGFTDDFKTGKETKVIIEVTEIG